MKFSILSLHPGLFQDFRREALIGRACKRGHIQVELHNFRDFAEPPHYRVDDRPFGGGPGMLLRPEPIAECLKTIPTHSNHRKILLSARGTRFTQEKAKSLSSLDQLVLICGRYEGVDQRIADQFVDEELSLGDFVLMGGEVAAMTVVESVARLLPGVLGNSDSLNQESFSESSLTEYPQYTRPSNFNGYEVPEVLRSGNHQEVERWRQGGGT